MRPLRSLSRKSSIDQSTCSDVQSRLLLSFSKANSKNSDKNAIFNLSKTSAQLFASCSKQNTNGNHISAGKYTSSSLSFTQAPIQRISMTPEQSLSQKQGMIEHLKLQMQQSRYIITSLRQQVKELTYQLQDKKSFQTKQIQKCIRCQSTEKQLDFLKDNEMRSKEIIEMYEGIVEKLEEKMEKIEKQNLLLRNNQFKALLNANVHDNEPEGLDFSNIQAQNALKQKKTFSNRVGLTINTDQKENHSASLNYNGKSHSKFVQKQNHPSTPKSNLPLSLSKSKHPNGKDNNLTLMQQQLQSHQKNSNQPQLRMSPTSSKRKTNQSPYKLKQRLINGQNRKSSHTLSEQMMEDENNCLNMNMSINMNPKLNKKIYF